MLNTRGMGQSRTHVRKLVIVAMLSAISMFLGLSGLGFIRLPIFSLTIMHLPVIIGAILEGPIVGASVGLIFGLFSMYQNIIAPTLTSFIFYNPIIALVPRVLIGLVAYYSYTILSSKVKNAKITIGVSAILATLTNTIGVLGLTYIIYIDQYAKAMEISTNTVAATLSGIALTNGVPEAIASALITVPVIIGILKFKRK